MNYSCRMFCKICLLKRMTLSLERIFVSFCCPPVVLEGTLEAVQHYFSYCVLLVSFRNEFEVHQTREFWFSESLSGAIFANWASGLSCVFIVSGHSASKPRSAKCCNDGSPSKSFSHLHKWSQVLGHLSYQGPFAAIAHLSLAKQPALGGVLVVPNFIPLRMGTLNAAEMFP